jgi:hypothetical protein
VSVTDRFDWQTALEGLRLLEHAHQRYSDAELSLISARLNPEELYEAKLWLYGLAVDTLTRVRGLHDWCRGEEGRVPLHSYLDSLVEWDYPGPVRTERPSQIAEVLAGSRFIVNKGIHVFATLARTTTVYIAPGGMDPTQFGLLTWLPVDALPPVSQLGRIDAVGRDAYKRLLTGGKVETILNMLGDHFHRWLVEQPAAASAIRTTR